MNDTVHPSARALLPVARDIDPDEIYDELELPDGPPRRPYVVLNMVSTVDGKIAVAGAAAGIGSPLDKQLMKRIRAAADGLLVGASTLRAEPVPSTVPDDLAARRKNRGRSPSPLAITLSRKLSLDPTWPYFRGPDSTVIFASAQAPADRLAALAERATVIQGSGDDVDLVEALAALRRDWGIRRLLCEGGPSLNQQLLDYGLVDEIFWTIAPKLAGGSGGGAMAGELPAQRIAAQLDLVSLFEHRGELFARYRVARS